MRRRDRHQIGRAQLAVLAAALPLGLDRRWRVHRVRKASPLGTPAIRERPIVGRGDVQHGAHRSANRPLERRQGAIFIHVDRIRLPGPGDGRGRSIVRDEDRVIRRGRSPSDRVGGAGDQPRRVHGAGQAAHALRGDALHQPISPHRLAPREAVEDAAANRRRNGGDPSHVECEAVVPLERARGRVSDGGRVRVRDEDRAQ